MSLKDQIARDKERLANLEKAMAEYPDLRSTKDRWGNIEYLSSRADKEATGYVRYHSCGCCSDAPLYCRPYLIYHGIKILGTEIMIGERRNFYDFPEYGWEQKLTTTGIPQSQIDILRTYFEEQAAAAERAEED